MIKALILLSKVSYDRKQINPRKLVEILDCEDVKYDWGFYEDILFYINQEDTKLLLGSEHRDIRNFDLVYHRRWEDSADEALAAYIYLKKHNVKQIDSELDRPGSTNKLTQTMRFWENRLPTPKTIYFNNSSNINVLNTDIIKNSINYPCVIKSTSGTRGSDNYLVNNLSQVEKILNTNPGSRYLIQEYIKNDGDYRVFVCGSKAELIIKRKGQNGDYKNNVSQGASAELMPNESLSESIISKCIQAANIFRRDIAGVDVVIDKDNPSRFFLFEVNRAPQIEDSSFESKKAQVLNTYIRTLVKEAGND